MSLSLQTLRRALVAVAALPALLAAQGIAAGTDPWTVLRAETWQKPSPNVERIVMAPRTDISFSEMSPDGRAAVRLTGPGRGAIAQYGQPHLWLGGLQVDHRANRARALTNSQYTGIELADPRTGATRRVDTPAGANVSDAVWSPDGSKLAYWAHTPTSTDLYIADARTGRSTRLTRTGVLATFHARWSVRARRRPAGGSRSGAGARQQRRRRWSAGAPQRVHR
jgi:dipeptidyl aminopeptidase/acylaminoacyl peptidase